MLNHNIIKQSLKAYLQERNIEPLYLSVTAGVRYLTVYNAVNGKPISVLNAQKMKVALQQLTGEAYPGLLPVLEPIEEQQTQPLRKLTLLR